MTQNKIKIKVYSKINLSLNIMGVRDNMHALDMVMTSVDIADVITVSKRTDNKINVEFDDGKTYGELDTATKTARLLLEKNGGFGADIFIQKAIPECAGLGGSSADAAGVFIALDNLYKLNLTSPQMAATALKVGSDVPYMLTGGFCRVKSTGETVEKINSPCEFNVVICKDKRGVSSKLAYQKFDEIYKDKKLILSDNILLIKALEDGDFLEAVKHFDNALQLPSVKLEPQIQNTLNHLNSTDPLKSIMTGSGSACVGFYKTFNEALMAEEQLKKLGLYAKAAVTKNHGIEIL